MKHLKTYETKNTDDLLQYFLKNYENYIQNRHWDNDIKYYIKDYNFPIEFKYEFSLLYFLYSNSRNNFVWRTDDKLINNQIKRKIKKYVTNLIYNKIENNIELYFKLEEMYKNKPNWYKPTSRNLGTIYDVNIKYIFQVFHTIFKKFDIFSKYNL